MVRRLEMGSNLRGVLFMAMAVMVLPVMDGFAKHLSADFAMPQILWARFFFQSLLIVPIAWVGYRGLFQRSLLEPIQIFRGLCIMVATGLFFTAISTMPIADALALIFIAPIIVTALSPWLLGEQVGPRRWTAVAVGFAGTLIIIRPGPGILDSGAIFAAGAGLCFAFYVISTRKLSSSVPPVVTLAVTSVVGTVATSVVAPAYWAPAGPADLAMMAAIGLTSAIGHYLMIKALVAAPASLVAPIGYGEIVGATLVGYFWFGDFPSAMTWTGIAIVIASGFYISIRARKRAEAEE